MDGINLLAQDVVELNEKILMIFLRMDTHAAVKGCEQLNVLANGPLLLSVLAVIFQKSLRK